MADARVCMHRGARQVSLAALAGLPMPTKLGPWHNPIHPATFADTLVGVLRDNGLNPMDMRFFLARNNEMLFGAMTIETFGALTMSKAMAFRMSTGQQLAIQLVAGQRVFVCDNLALSGDTVVLKRKSTTGLQLTQALDDAIPRLRAQFDDLDEQIKAMRVRFLSSADALNLLARAVVEDVLPARALKPTFATFEAHKTPDTEDDTAWSLHNSITRWVGANQPGLIGQQTTQKIMRYFERD